jgi:mono/diheme cytochrome c family protein
MSMRERLLLREFMIASLIALAGLTKPATGAPAAGGLPGGPVGGPGLGRAISEADVRGWDISVLPDGTGLPPGQGTAAQGAVIYAQRCAACHGANGKGGANAALIGRAPLDKGVDSVKTIAGFWGDATTLFDYIRRAMPWPQPRSLSNDEVYSLTAWILAGNSLIGEGDTMNATTLPRVQMPNRDGFIIRFPDKI